MLEDNFPGKGETATLNILKMLTNLKHKSLKKFPDIGIFKHVPIEWIIPEQEFQLLSKSHKKGMLDLMMITKNSKIGIRVQGKGHGFKLKGIGKARHDSVQKSILFPYCQIVDIKLAECPEVFKEKVTNKAIEEVVNSFKTEKVMIPIC